MENENYKGISSAQEDQLQNNSQQPVEDEMDEDSAAKERLTSTDPTKVVFLSANSEYTRKNGDAKVDIENVQRSVGMGKEELLKYANEPFWVRLRMTLFVLFWVLWLGMLIGSVAIIVIVPGCPAAPRLQWWQKTTIYQVMVGSFKDSDGDKKGDLPGLTSKLDYFSTLKVDSLLLSPIFASAGPHAPSEVTNFTDIAHHYGTFTDFQNLISTANEKNIKMILDFIPNHTSDKHPWFIRSANGEDPYTDYYIWESSKEGSGEPGDEPNNWVNVNGGPAWTWNPQRKKFYLHQFHSGLPDLNLRNPHLRQELKNILVFWLNEGVDGFKVKDVDYLFEDNLLRDEPTGPGKDGLIHKYTRNQAENLELLREWREMFDNYTEASPEKHQRILLTEVASDSSKSAEYYGQSDNPVVDIPYNLGLTSLTQNSTPSELYLALQNSFNTTPSGLWPNFVLGTSHHPRLLSRVGSSLLDGIHMATLLSKGTPVVYFGDELGMEGGPRVKDQEGEDLDASTDVLMQWDNSSITPDAGQTNYVTVNAEMDKPRSHLSIFKSLLSLREKPAISFGIMEFPVVDNQIFSMLRVKKGTPGYLVVINFHGNDTVVNFSKSSDLLPEKADVELATPVPGFLKDSGNNKVTLSSVHVGPHQSAVLTFVPKDK